MAQPPAYSRSFDFSPLAPANVPEAGVRANGEFDALAAFVTAVRASLALIQRDDGRLANQAVHPESLSARTRALITGNWNLRGVWASATAYAVRDVVTRGGKGYVCLKAHTSGDFDDDLAADLWVEFYSENLIPADGSITSAMLSPAFTLALSRLGGYTHPGSGAVARTLVSRLNERLSVKDFGAAGDGVVDDTTALNTAATAAGALGCTLVFPAGTYKTTGTVSVPSGAAGVEMEDGAVISYAGAGSEPALVLGEAGTVRQQSKRYRGIRVVRASQADWTDESDVGVRLNNIDSCEVEIKQAEGFTIGVQLYGDQLGCEDSIIFLGKLKNNRFQLDLRTGTASGWMNSLVFHGGHFTNDSFLHTAFSRFGVRLSREPGAYALHNRLVFYGPNFELQHQGGAVAAIPFLCEVDSRALVARDVRMEACTNKVARHTAAAQDHVYELAYVGTHGYRVGVEYVGATRAGGTVVPLHQAAAAVHSPRLIAAAEHVRGRAFRWSGTETGFDGLALLSTNPAGPPSNLNGFCFPGLDGITLNADNITLPTSRALAFVVDCSLCKEFFVAAEGSELRIVVMQFDAAEAVLDNASPVLISNQGVTWQGSPSYMWDANNDLADASLARLQRVTLHDNAKFAAIGVRGGSASAVLKALRLYTPEIHAPQVIAGGTRRWGKRELFGMAVWDPPSLNTGETAAHNITLNDVMPGDFVQASFSVSTALPFIAQASAGDTVTVRVWNPSPSTVDLAEGVVFVRAVKPRL